MAQQEFPIEGNFRTGAAHARTPTRPRSSLISRQFCHISIAAHVDNGFPAKFNIVPFRRLTRHGAATFCRKLRERKKGL